MSIVLLNGKFKKDAQLKLSYDSAWAKFAIGFFETIKVYNQQLLFWDFHYKRLTTAAKFWAVSIPKKKALAQQLLKLCKKNQLSCARLRIQFNVDLMENKADYFAATYILEDDAYFWRKKGWNCALYKQHKKPIRKEQKGFKSSNRMIYLLATKWKHKQQLDDAFIMNTENHIVDSTICNVFWVKEGVIYATSKNDGINGVLKAFLLSNQKEWGIKIKSKKCTQKQLLQADEIFLTNVIRGIVPVSKYEQQKYGNSITKALFQQLKAWERSLC